MKPRKGDGRAGRGRPSGAGPTSPTACIAVIPARGGSKGIPRKNLAPLGSKPLVAWSVEAAARSGRFDRVFVSTDDADIAEVARAWGAEVPFLRPADLAGDRISPHEGVSHLLSVLVREGELKPPLLVASLFPTFPFRRSETIARCVDGLLGSEFCNVVTYSRAGSWTGRYFFEESGRWIPVKIRWRGRGEYFRNGCVAVERHPVILDPLAEPLSAWEERVRRYMRDLKRRGRWRADQEESLYVEVEGYEAIDIDTPQDLERARRFLESETVPRETETWAEWRSSVRRAALITEDRGHGWTPRRGEGGRA